MTKFIPFFIITLCFVNCQKPFEFNKEEQYKLINENLYNDFFKKEQQKVLLNEFQLMEPEKDLLDFDYKKEKAFLESDVNEFLKTIEDSTSTSKSFPLAVPPPPPPVPNVSDKKWDKTKLSNFALVNETKFKRKNEKHLFAISNPIYNPKIKIALIKLERYRIDGGWNCIPFERFFLFKRQNNSWVNLNKEGALSPYLILYEYYKNQETKQTLPLK